MGWPAVRGYQKGDKVTPEVMNTPLKQLTERTEYLKNMIAVHGSTKIVVNVSVPGTGLYGHPEVGQPVYRKDDGTFAQAVGEALNNAWFYASRRSMALGVVQTVSNTSATVVLFGSADFSDVDLTAASVISDKNPTSGRYYLSTRDGKLTSKPVGPVIYIGDVHLYTNEDGELCVHDILVSPQYRDTGESHVHRAFVMSGRPMGGYAIKGTSSYTVSNILADEVEPGSDGAIPAGMSLEALGDWTTSDVVSYTITVGRKAGKSETSSAWSDYYVAWSSEEDGKGESDISFTGVKSGLIAIGAHGLKIRATLSSSSVSPASLVSDEIQWTVSMPSAGKAWINTSTGFKLNLGMYMSTARYVPPLPDNGAALIVGGLEFRSGALFSSTDKQWDITLADADGGPWLNWYGNAVVGAGSTPTTPFKWSANNESPAERDIVLHVNRMRVGPTGFVTSLQPAAGSPLRITSAQTGEDAVQGALQVAMDINFSTAEKNVEGHQVVKRINGASFETGPVVERIIPGPGIWANRQQGSVTLSVSNAVYAGDFETIALKNAKQDLAGGVFPYTKLLGWSTSGTNVDTGFTAKFRVPDHIPYKKYKVIVSASVFGEKAPGSAKSAAFKASCFALKDFACSEYMGVSLPSDGLKSSVADPTVGRSAVVTVAFGSSYTAFDPIVVHGFDNITSDSQQVQESANMLMCLSDGSPLCVYPGYFVGLAIDRCGLVSGGTAIPYEDPIGFLSLRWNLVEYKEAT